MGITTKYLCPCINGLTGIMCCSSVSVSLYATGLQTAKIAFFVL